MSQENLEVVRGAIEDWNRRDWKAWMAKHDADMVAVLPKEWPEQPTIEGCETWFPQVQVMLESWAERRLEIDDTKVSGDMVILSFRWVARGRDSKIDVDIPLVGNYTVTNGRIQRIDFFLERSEALKAAGLADEAADYVTARAAGAAADWTLLMDDRAPRTPS